MSGCNDYRDLIHARLDGELPGGRAADLDAHLDACASCRELADDLAAVASGLRALPEHPLPPAVLQEVFDRTVRRRRVILFPRLTQLPWKGWAAGTLAAAVLIALVFYPRYSATRGPSPEDLARAQGEVRMVLSLTARAMQRAEIAASDRVLAAQVAPALHRVPIAWSALHNEKRKP
jgi:predicted anti-sigma-YlaC factor YlaD